MVEEAGASLQCESYGDGAKEKQLDWQRLASISRISEAVSLQCFSGLTGILGM